MAAGLTFNIFGKDVSATSTLHKVEGESKSTSSKIGSHFKTMGKVIGGAFAAAGVVNFLKGSIDEATEAQKVGAQTAAVLKSTGQAAGVTASQIGDLATAISNKAGIDDEAIQSGENLLLTFTNIRNEAGKGNDIFSQTTQIMTDLSVATGQSMKTSAIQLGKALNDPVKGISALQRVGVSFTDGQKKQIAALVKSGKTMQAQKVILAELNKEFGGSAAAQVTPAEKAKVAWGNLQEQIGTYLLPIVTKLANFLTQHVIPAISAMASWVQKNSGWLVPLAGAIAAIVAVVKAWAIAQAALNIVMEANPIMLIVAGVAALAVGLVVAYKKSETFRNILKGVFHVVQAAFEGLGKAFQAVGHAIGDVFGFIRQHWGLMLAPLTGGFSLLIQHWRDVRDAFVGAWHFIRDNVFDKMKDGIRTLRDVVKTVVSAISGIFRKIGDGAKWAWDHTLGPIIRTIKAAIQDVIDLYSQLPGVHVTVKGQGSVAPSLGGAVGGGKAGHKAQGTGFFGGGLTWMNELGPELVSLPRGARIDSASTSASKRGGMGGGAAVVQINVNAPTYATAADVGRAIKIALEAYVNRGGKVTIASGVN